MSRGAWGGGTVVRLDDIQSIVPSNDPRGSEAASLDRLRIDGGGRVVFIAVHDKERFLDAVAEASDALQRDGMTVVRSE